MISFLERLDKPPVSTMPFWKKINQIRKNKSDSFIPVLIKDGIEYNTKEDKAKIFAEKLINTFNEPLSNDFDNEFKTKIGKYIEKKEFEKENNSKKIEKFTLKELNKEISKLNNKKTIDSLGLNNVIIKAFTKKISITF